MEADSMMIDRHGGPWHSKHWQFPQTEGPWVLLGVDGASAVLVLLGGTCPGTGGLEGTAVG